MSPIGWLAIRWLYVLAMALFVGGQLMLIVAVIPALRSEPRPALRSVARRFGWASLAALAALIATGSALASHDMRWSSDTLPRVVRRTRIETSDGAGGHPIPAFRAGSVGCAGERRASTATRPLPL